MNMNKSLIALAVAGVFASSAATAAVDVYGQANVSYDIVNNDSNRDSQGVASNGSRFGLKGSEDLGGGLSAIWQIENQIAIGAGLGGTENPGSNTSIAFRDTFAGLKSDTAGTVRLGRFDTPYKLATRGMDMFHNTLADNRSLMGLGHDVRASNSVGFNSLNYSGFSAAASYFGDQGGTAPGFNTPTSGTANTLFNTNEGFSIAGMYDAGPYHATAAYQTISNGLSNTNISTDAWKIGGGYSVDAFALNGVYERISNRNGSGDASAWYLSGKYNLTSTDALKLAYTDVNNHVNEAANSGAKQYSVGYDHKMSNRTTLYALYTKLDNDQNGNYLLGWNSASTSVSNAGIGQSPSAFSAGMKHSF
ncbi:MAG: porin [Candidatus Nitrotoga sp.]